MARNYPPLTPAAVLMFKRLGAYRTKSPANLSVKISRPVASYPSTYHIFRDISTYQDVNHLSMHDIQHISR